MCIKEVSGNTFCIDTGTTYIPFYKINNTEIIMLDSGRLEGQRDIITDILEKNNFKVVGIICTHAHIDHIGNITYLKEKYKCTVAMPAYEAYVCSSAINLKVFYTRLTLTDVVRDLGHLVCETDVIISKNQEKIMICNIEFKILHTPGHSPEHICIITPDNVAYLGDALISYGVMKRSKIPYTFILMEDLKSKLCLNNLICSKYIVAHKGIYNNISKLIIDNIEFYKDRANKIYDVLEDSMTIEEITKTAIKSFNIGVKNINKYFLIERMLKSHVDYLKEIGMFDLVIEDGLLKYRKVQR
jgi:hydroxyacylglutathione hydrolase